MRLTVKDAFATLLVLVGLAFAYSVVAGWGWPLMNGPRAGMIALFAASFIACPVSWRMTTPDFFKSPYFIVASIVGVVLLGVTIVGLVVGTVVYLEWMMAGVVLMVLITLTHRLVPESRAPRVTLT